MKVFERGLTGSIALVVLLGLALVSVRADASRTTAPGHVATTTIVVTVGTPSETSVKLTKNSLIPAGVVIFKVTNRGHAAHTFKVCASPNGGTANTCTGKSVVAQTGGSGSLTLTLAKGRYEFLSTVSGQSVSGMKGMIGVGLAAAATTSTIPPPHSTTTTSSTPPPPKTSSTPTTTTTALSPTSPAPGFPVGNPSNGGSVFASAGCGSCHTLAAAGTTGTTGPNLDQLKLTISLIETQVSLGGLDMPAFNSSLSMQQIADLATYVYQSTQHP
jgi:hypothetical protein